MIDLERCCLQEPAVFIGDLPGNHVQMEAAVANACAQPPPVHVRIMMDFDTKNNGGGGV